MAEPIDYRPHVFEPMTKAYKVTESNEPGIKIGENVMPQRFPVESGDGRATTGAADSCLAVGPRVSAMDCFGHEGEVDQATSPRSWHDGAPSDGLSVGHRVQPAQRLCQGALDLALRCSWNDQGRRELTMRRCLSIASRNPGIFKKFKLPRLARA